MERYLWFAGGVALGIVVGSRVGRAPYDGVVTAAHRIWDSRVLRDAVGATRTEPWRLHRTRIGGPPGDDGDEIASDSTDDIATR
jgi:hypothetical protein